MKKQNVTYICVWVVWSKEVFEIWRICDECEEMKKDGQFAKITITL